MKHLILSLIFLLGCGCGSFKNLGKKNKNISSELQSTYNTYLALSSEQKDADGFINTDRCDSLLFTSLLAVGTNTQVTIKAARDETGQWWRRPSGRPGTFQRLR